jgi:hypothetical protein
MMTSKIWFGLVLIIFHGILGGCTLKTVDTLETGEKDAPQSRVLIATQASKFKDAVVLEIRDRLAENSCYIKVIDLKRLMDESTADYHAVVILSQCMAGRPDPRVETFIDAVPQKNKVVLLTTGALESWKPDSNQVDAMTSASVLSESNRIAQSIVGKVLVLIDAPKNGQLKPKMIGSMFRVLGSEVVMH